ncbi:hypothetical protein SALBM311S_07164 [Streptomyces alboniger]
MAPPAGQGERAGATLFLHGTKQVRLPATVSRNSSLDVQISGRTRDARPTDRGAHPHGPAVLNLADTDGTQPANPDGPRPTSPDAPQPVTASHRLHTPSPSISTAAILVMSRSGTLFIRAFPPTMPSPATAHSASTAPRPTEIGSS